MYFNYISIRIFTLSLFSFALSLDYPEFEIITLDSPYQQDMFISSTASEGNQFLAILDPELHVKWYVVTNNGKGWDFKVNNNDKISYFRKPSQSWTPSGGGLWYIMDQSMHEVDTLSCVNGFEADYHDIQYTDSGGYILQAYGKEEIDIPQTEVLDTAITLVIQEFDENHNLIMQWKNSDHMNIMDYVDEFNLNSQYRKWTHGNSLEVDYDENIILSNRTMSEVIKFHRETGELIWRLGGPMNDFTFINDPLGGPNRQHDVRRLENGNIMIFDNGDGRPLPLTRVTEYEINESQMTATLIWSYSHPNGYVGLNQGCAQRLENNNTLISWGGVSDHGQIITEVDYDQNIVLEIEYPQGHYSYKVRKSDWNFDFELTELDINLDQNVDILDIVYTINFILSGDEPHPFHLYKIDLDKNGDVDILDIIILIDFIL